MVRPQASCLVCTKGHSDCLKGHRRHVLRSVMAIAGLVKFRYSRVTVPVMNRAIAAMRSAGYRSTDSHTADMEVRLAS